MEEQLYIQLCFYKLKKCIDSCITIEQLDKLLPFVSKIYYDAKKINLDADLSQLIIAKGRRIIANQIKYDKREIQNDSTVRFRDSHFE